MVIDGCLSFEHIKYNDSDVKEERKKNFNGIKFFGDWKRSRSVGVEGMNREMEKECATMFFGTTFSVLTCPPPAHSHIDPR